MTEETTTVNIDIPVVMPSGAKVRVKGDLDVTVDQQPLPPPPPPNPSGNIGPDGVLQLYPTVAGGTAFYLTDNPDKSKFNVSFGTGSHLPYTKKTENGLTFFNTAGSPITYHSGQPPGRSVRLDCYPDGGIWNNKTKYSYKSNPGFLYTDKGLASCEMTGYFRPHGKLGTHQCLAFKMAGRDEDPIRSVFEICYAEDTHKDCYAHWDFMHFPYVSCPTTNYPHGKMTDGKWVGAKVVRLVSADKKQCDWYLFEDIDPFDSSSNGKPKNNWKLVAHAVDRGTKEYDNIVTTWKNHKDLIRIDGFQNVDFALISDRAIDNTSVQPKPNEIADQKKETKYTVKPTENEAPNLQEAYNANEYVDVVNEFGVNVYPLKIPAP